jgi:hypothetical protein
MAQALQGYFKVQLNRTTTEPRSGPQWRDIQALPHFPSIKEARAAMRRRKAKLVREYGRADWLRMRVVPATTPEGL